MIPKNKNINEAAIRMKSLTQPAPMPEAQACKYALKLSDKGSLHD